MHRGAPYASSRSAFELAGLPHLLRLQRYAQLAGRALRRPQFQSFPRGIHEGSNTRQSRGGFLEELQALSLQLRGPDGQSREVPAGPREAGDQPIGYRIPPVAAKTMGITVVACFAATIAGSPLAKRTSTFRRASSAATS